MNEFTSYTIDQPRSSYQNFAISCLSRPQSHPVVTIQTRMAPSDKPNGVLNSSQPRLAPISNIQLQLITKNMPQATMQHRTCKAKDKPKTKLFFNTPINANIKKHKTPLSECISTSSKYQSCIFSNERISQSRINLLLKDYDNRELVKEYNILYSHKKPVPLRKDNTSLIKIGLDTLRGCTPSIQQRIQRMIQYLSEIRESKLLDEQLAKKLEIKMEKLKEFKEKEFNSINI